ADSARIDHAQPPSGPSPVDLRPGLLQQLASNERKPIRRIAQTTIQRWTREVGNRARLRPGTAAAQRTAAGVDQGKPQQVDRTPYPRARRKALNWRAVSSIGTNSLIPAKAADQVQSPRESLIRAGMAAHG